MATRRKRKPMSPEQRAQAAERLKAAREKRQKNNPPDYKNVHPDVLARDDEYYLSHKKVKSWIKNCRELLKEERKAERQNVKGAHSQVKSLEGYIRNMEKYLRDGDWVDDFYGENGDKKIKWRCTRLAYDKEGNPKRTQGVYYEDLGYRWGEEPAE